MALSCCSVHKLLVTTAVGLLAMLPLPYYNIPEIIPGKENPVISPVENEFSTGQWFDHAVSKFPVLDVLVTIIVLVISLTFYLFDWIQRKILERRLKKLNERLITSREKVRIWDIHQEELEHTLKMVNNAASEYNLLLYLLLRKSNYLEDLSSSPSEIIFEKCLNGDITLQTYKV